MKRMRAVLLS